ncbi:hypothetical protein [Bradyrhizobium sp. CCBAU 53380]|uniref:hypothetical protein n=1 Tax=Bradyrhizobium sp. CCBAU 53380 TaxID=1325117 RepID=UPI002304C419|nr:hypothetical protein [Bradyrhizobium sp. CCBAU 53380]MDA9424022.1 hypothetical protein [Bradyrhizobium sp. CCBAU 53380]
MTGDDASHRKQYVLRLQPLPGANPIRALRWVLKRLLRQYGLRCIDIREDHYGPANEENGDDLSPPTNEV